MEVRALGRNSRGLDLSQGLVVKARGLRVGTSAAAVATDENLRPSAAGRFMLQPNYVGLRAERIWVATDSRVWKHETADFRVLKHRCKSQRIQRVCRSNWGDQIPFANVFWETVNKPLQKIQDRNIFATKLPEVIEKTDHAKAETDVHFSQHRTVDIQTQNGELSPAAIDCIEQFSRLNGLTGKKMRANFESTAPTSLQSDGARNLVEFTCFRYLARCNTDFHPSLKDAAFRRLTFSAMLAWQRPYKNDIPQNGTTNGLPRAGFVGKKAFTRIAPAIAGAADRPTAHYLFDALVGDNEGLTFDIWDRYCSELCKVERGRDQQRDQESNTLELVEGECIICVGADTRQPVQKWSKNVAWPGRLTLTDRALYFEANGLTHHQKATRLDLSGPGALVEGKKVGPFGVELFDSAMLVSSNKQSESWILEFVDFRGVSRRNVWLAIVKEIIAVHAFIREYGVKEDDPLVGYIYGAKQGRKKAINSAVAGITRLQAVQTVLGKIPSNPERLLQFSHLANAPSGELVLQALAVALWGGRLEVKVRDIDYLSLGGNEGLSDEAPGLASQNLVGTDGTVYLRNWATSPSWRLPKSHAFWRAKTSQKGIVLGKNHIVGGLTQVERAVSACREKSQLAEKTQATIDGALLKGIPNNVDLLKELLLPFSVAAVHLQTLKQWKNPVATSGFLCTAFGIIYLNWLRFVFPLLLLSGAAAVYGLRVLKTNGRLRDDFGKITIREQPPTNTIQQVLALKEALSALENFLQTSNIILLKLRTVALSREPRVTNEILMALLGLGVAMLVVPFRFLFGMFLLDQFTCELKFREKSVRTFYTYLNEWWMTIPAAPVELLPPENSDSGDSKSDNQGSPTRAEAVMQAMSEWLGEDSEVSQLAGGTFS